MIYLQLFLSYLKIGFFGFGGGDAMLSLIQHEVVIAHGWITNEELTDIIAVSQMTPGPISINSATYIGYVSGQQVSLSTSIKYPVLAGGIAVCQETTGAVRNMVQLMPMKIDKVGAASVLSSNGERFEMTDDAQVYLWYKGQYYYTKLTSVNSDDYYLTGWYDNFGCAAGKKVRIIVAVKKD